MAFNKNLVVAGFALALLVAASYGDFPRAMASAYDEMPGDNCSERTEIECTSDVKSDVMCMTMCLKKGDSYITGYCWSDDKEASSSCICVKECDARFPHGAAGLGPATA